jgi:hypothetical protein
LINYFINNSNVIREADERKAINKEEEDGRDDEKKIKRYSRIGFTKKITKIIFLKICIFNKLKRYSYIIL